MSIVQDEELTYNKVEKFVESTLPLILNRMITFDGGTIIVGLYRIVSRNSEYAVMLGRRRLQVFPLRSWAITYAYALSTGQQNQADEISKIYKKFSKLDEDRMIFEHRIDFCRQNGAYDKKTMYQHRLSRCLAELESVRNDFDQLVQKLGIG